jgi:hypothetical protein
VPAEPCCDPVLIVGAGLSAADAVIAARFRSLPILHVFRKKAAALGTGSTQLPENMYPEYHKVSADKVIQVLSKHLLLCISLRNLSCSTILLSKICFMFEISVSLTALLNKLHITKM